MNYKKIFLYIQKKPITIMKNIITNFEKFNENVVNELNMSTIYSAHDKMYQKKQYRRAEKLINLGLKDLIGIEINGDTVKSIYKYENGYNIILNKENTTNVKNADGKESMSNFFRYNPINDETNLVEVNTRKDFNNVMKIIKKLNPETKINQDIISIRDYR